MDMVPCTFDAIRAAFNCMNDKKEVSSVRRERCHDCPSSSSSRGRLLLVEVPIPRPIPLCSSTSMANLAAPSDPFLGRVRVRRRAPKACAFMTARVLEMGGWPDGDGERDECEAALDCAVFLRERRPVGDADSVRLSATAWGSSTARKVDMPPVPSIGRSGPVFVRRRFIA